MQRPAKTSLSDGGIPLSENLGSRIQRRQADDEITKVYLRLFSGANTGKLITKLSS